MRLGQLVRDRRHDLRVLLRSLVAPIGQLGDDVRVELARETRNWSVSFAFRTMAAHAGRNVGAGNALLEDFLSRGHVGGRSASDGWRVEVVKCGGKRPDHRRAEHVAHVEHDVGRAGRRPVHPLVFGKALQLVLDILDLLSGKARYGVEAHETTHRRAVADLAIFHLGVYGMR